MFHEPRRTTTNLVELYGMEEVRGSIPLSSTTPSAPPRAQAAGVFLYYVVVTGCAPRQASTAATNSTSVS